MHALLLQRLLCGAFHIGTLLRLWTCSLIVLIGMLRTGRAFNVPAIPNIARNLVLLADTRSRAKIMTLYGADNIRRTIHSLDTSSKSADGKSVWLEKGKARLFQFGNPLIYSGAIKKVEGSPQIGDVVLVKDEHGNLFAKGFFNPVSQYRVRLIAMTGETCFKREIQEILRHRIEHAIQLRRSLGLPSEATSAYRLINGEGDRLGGLIVDVLGKKVVVQSSAYWVELYREIINSILQECFCNQDTGKRSWDSNPTSLTTTTTTTATANTFPGLDEEKEKGNESSPGHSSAELLWRRAESRLRQDGYDLTHYSQETNSALTNSKADYAFGAGRSGPQLLRPSIDGKHRTGSTTGVTLLSDDKDGYEHTHHYNDDVDVVADADEYHTIIENGIKYTLSAKFDQKTGFYCDQRENRMLIRSLSAGKSVLDTYCYTGGFALNALIGGAESVLAVDSSSRALSAAMDNIRLNGVQLKGGTVQGQSSAATGTARGSTSSSTQDITSASSRHGYEQGVVEAGGVEGVGVAGGVAGGGGVVELHEGDCVAVMKQLRDADRTFDIVICDPPKLAPSRNALPRATSKYQKINSLAMSLVNKEQGGLLLSCTCSAAMTQSGKFTEMLSKAARAAGREVTVLSLTGAASDHPVLPAYPEGRYLTAALLHVR